MTKLSEFKSLEVGLSVSRRLHPEVSEEGDLRVAAAVSRMGAAGSWLGSGKASRAPGPSASSC